MTQMRARERMPAVLARADAFGAASRHSRRVRILKYAVPAVAGFGVIAFGLVALFNPFATKDIDVDVGKLQVSGDRLTMELPRLTGFNKRQQSYNVTAKTASQRLTAPGLIDLSNLEAVISMPDKTSATLRAMTGSFDSNSELLTVHDKVTVASTKGYSADLLSATVDFKRGTVRSDDPVKVMLTSGVVEAGSLHVQSGGDTITFAGGVATSFKGKSGTAPQVAPAPDTKGSNE
jgi:lipopolysaccharide export system protein LptC